MTKHPTGAQGVSSEKFQNKQENAKNKSFYEPILPRTLQAVKCFYIDRSVYMS